MYTWRRLRPTARAAILEREFGVRYSLMGAYDLLHRLGYSALRPRPRHEKRDLAKQAEFRERAPLLSSS
ncbi:MAG: winged helix-turn-helix domain-containing protein [Phycisphaerales bacterium]